MEEERVGRNSTVRWITLLVFLAICTGAFFVGANTVKRPVIRQETVLHKCSYCQQKFETINRMVADERTARNQCMYCYIKYTDFLAKAYEVELTRQAQIKALAEKKPVTPNPTNGGEE